MERISFQMNCGAMLHSYADRRIGATFYFTERPLVWSASFEKRIPSVVKD